MLVVAQNEANLHLLEDFLGGQSVPVTAASDPADLQAFPDPDDVPPAAIVDVDGYGEEVWSLIDRLREAGTAVVVLTRYRTEQVQRATLQHPVRTVIEKPVRKAELQAIVDTLTSGRSATG